MPFTTVVGLTFIFAMFGAFMVALAGAAIWVALGERAERKTAPARAPLLERTHRRYEGAELI